MNIYMSTFIMVGLFNHILQHPRLGLEWPLLIQNIVRFFFRFKWLGVQEAPNPSSHLRLEMEQVRIGWGRRKSRRKTKSQDALIKAKMGTRRVTNAAALNALQDVLQDAAKGSVM